MNKVGSTRIFVEDENLFLLKVTSNDSMSTGGINTTATSSSNNNKPRESRKDSGSAARHRRDVMQKLQDTVSSMKSWKIDDVIETSK